MQASQQASVSARACRGLKVQPRARRQVYSLRAYILAHLPGSERVVRTPHRRSATACGACPSPPLPLAESPLCRLAANLCNACGNAPALRRVPSRLLCSCARRPARYSQEPEASGPPRRLPRPRRRRRRRRGGRGGGWVGGVQGGGAGGAAHVAQPHGQLPQVPPHLDRRAPLTPGEPPHSLQASTAPPQASPHATVTQGGFAWRLAARRPRHAPCVLVHLVCWPTGRHGQCVLAEAPRARQALLLDDDLIEPPIHIRAGGPALIQRYLARVGAGRHTGRLDLGGMLEGSVDLSLYGLDPTALLLPSNRLLQVL
jgi:hypothetical protein